MQPKPAFANLARQLPAADMSIKAGKWDRKSFMGVELSGKTLGVVGCGRIGQVVAGIAQTMGMHVIGYDPVMTSEQLRDVGIERGDLDDIWAKCDFITVHTPLTPETANLVSDATIEKCKPGVRIINCARGGIVDEAALLRGLESGKVAAPYLTTLLFCDGRWPARRWTCSRRSPRRTTGRAAARTPIWCARRTLARPPTRRRCLSPPPALPPPARPLRTPYRCPCPHVVSHLCA